MITPKPTATIRKTRTRAWVWGALFVLSGVVILSTSFTVFRGSGFYFTIAVVAIALNVVLFGASFIRAGNELHKVLKSEPEDSSQILRALPHFAPPFVVQILALVTIAFFLSVMFAIGTSDREYAWYRAQRVQLDSLRSLQERYLIADHDGNGRPDSIYADGLSKLPNFKAGYGVWVTITHGSRDGWAAVTAHAGLAGDEGCAIFVGKVPDVPKTLGGKREQKPGVVYCD